MAAEIPYSEPRSFVRGEKLHWRRSFPDFPATEYALEYRFRGTTGDGFDVSATAYNSDFDVAVAAAVTGAGGIAAETYRWQAWLTEIADATNTFLADSGKTVVEEGFATDDASPVDSRSSAKQTLDAIDAMIAGKATADVAEYTIQGRQLKRYPLKDLLELRTVYANIVARENLQERRRSGKGMLSTSYIRVSED